MKIEPISNSEKPLAVKVLQWVYLIIFLFSIGTIVTLHNLPDEILIILRVPRFLREIDPFLGFAWPASFHIYQATLLLFLFLIFIDGLGLFFYQSRFWRLISDLSSFVGLFVIWSVFLFFIFSLTLAEGFEERNIQTTIVFLLLAFFLFILDLITFLVDEQSLGRRLLKKRNL